MFFEYLITYESYTPPSDYSGVKVRNHLSVVPPFRDTPYGTSDGARNHIFRGREVEYALFTR